ncbi:hypothetical protein BHE90_015243 [Fusarium euwallaceae]|uniref:Uncharacterized protein n=4 Tax=Fusarium solani species complex TaxID=232080 RepID=A0A3M2RE99_9HYPO|nr:hypothetical protein CDV36_014848 [Fusarium kuroshium]RSL92861.1 hypothetical protein CEP52_013600 [Fusarium oligoseptatum]RSM06830.1 hypothetical protein CDV31_008927 [Fusarium ambrosium]RTE70352.1 hypothetical protein BHE90_015243 [Fusarium euwallaceae]
MIMAHTTTSTTARMEILEARPNTFSIISELLHPRMESSINMTDGVALASLLSVQPAATASSVLRSGN